MNPYNFGESDRGLTPAQRERIIAAVKSRLGVITRCPACDHKGWTLAGGLVFLSMSDSSDTLMVGDNSLPSVAMTCNHCGNTLLLNLRVLGLADLWTKS